MISIREEIAEMTKMQAESYKNGIQDACKAICPSCDLGWDIVWSFDRFLHEIPEKARDDSGRIFMPCTASKIRELLKEK